MGWFFVHFLLAQPIANAAYSYYPRTHTWERPTAPSSVRELKKAPIQAGHCKFGLRLGQHCLARATEHDSVASAAVQGQTPYITLVAVGLSTRSWLLASRSRRLRARRGEALMRHEVSCLLDLKSVFMHCPSTTAAAAWLCVFQRSSSLKKHG